MQLTSLSLALTRAGFRSFSPASLFAAGDQGVWYDPSDFSTLFQDAAGTTPVTAVEQPVGLMLDESKGLVLGPELVVNSGGPFVETTGWTATLAGTTGLSVVGGKLQFSTGTGGGRITTPLAGLTVGATYKIALGAQTGTSGLPSIRITTGSDGVSGALFTQVLTGSAYTYYFTATATTLYLSLLSLAFPNTITTESASTKLLPGNHAFTPAAATTSRPVLSARVNLLTKTEQFDDGVWTKSNSFVQTNLLRWSEEFDNVYWVKQSASVTTNATTAPDGTTTAEKLVEDLSTTVHRIYREQSYTTDPHAFSCFLKAAERTLAVLVFSGTPSDGLAWFDLSTGTIGTQTNCTADIYPVGGGWYRCSITVASGNTGATSKAYIATATSNGSTSTVGDGVSGIFIWGAQLVQGTTPGDYQRTTAAAAAVGYPDIYGQPFAQKLVENSATDQHSIRIENVFTADGTRRTFSLYVKEGERRYLVLATTTTFNSASATAIFDTQTGTWVNEASLYTNYSSVSVGNGWWRIGFTSAVNDPSYDNFRIGLANGPASTNASYTGDGTSGIYIWGADLRVANDGVGIPAYQRVNTATDYDTVGFPTYLRFDGSDDFLQTNSVDFTATDKMTVWAGVRKLSDAAVGMLMELSNDWNTNNGACTLQAPPVANSDRHFFGTKGTVQSSATVPSGYPSPITNVLTGIGNISGDSTILRINGTQAASSTADQGTGNFGNYPLYIGRRGGSQLPFNGRLHNLIIRGAQTPTNLIQQTENWVNTKTAAYDAYEVANSSSFRWNAASTSPAAS
jgi:hypothetical protein